MRTLLLFFSVLCCFLQPLSAGKSELLRFRTFSPKGGFYYDGVVDINQDTDGFIWIMLDKDLLRFDGYEYRKYTNQFDDIDTTGTWSFIQFATGKLGQLYALTSNVICEYDLSTDTFTKLLDTPLENFAIDPEGRMWGLSDNILHRIDPEKGTLTKCFIDKQPLRNIRRYSLGDSNLFFASKDLIYKSTAANPDSISIFYTFPDNISIVGIKENNGCLWVLTAKHGLYCIALSSGQVERHFTFQNQTDSTSAKTFLIDREGNIWIGTQSGLYVLDQDTGKYTKYQHSKSNPFSITGNSVWTLFGDSNGNIWLGHFAGGLCYSDLDDGLRIGTFTSTSGSLNYELVSSFAEHDKYIYIGMDGGGINRLDKSTGDISQFALQKASQNPAFNHVKSLVVDSLSRLWAGMYRGGLDCYDLITKTTTNFSNNPADSSSLRYNDLRKIILDRDRGLWIAYQNMTSLVSYLSFDDYKFRHYLLDNGTGGYVFDIHVDEQNNLYALTRQKLFRINPMTNTCQEVEGSSFSGGQALAIDATGDVWIGTVGHGLLKYQPASNKFFRITDTLSHFSSAIYSLCPDTRTGSLWIGTDNGLVRFNPVSNESMRFDESDGFQGQVYFPLSAFRSKEGTMFFGGTNGFSIFDPASIKSNPRKPQARISAFYIDNQPVSQSIWKNTSAIELSHEQANFGFKFSSDNYQTPEKNKFKYRLKGYDDNWITTDASNRTVMYAKVPPGKYQFEVLAANNDGVWSDTPTCVNIVRHPAPWASPVAYFIYSMLVIVALWCIYHYWNEKRKLKMKLLMDSLDKQKKEELHQSQLRFFTNISHDFRTPISLILAAVDNMKQDGIKDYYHRILHNNSRRLLNLVNELLDFSTLDNNKMKLKVEVLDANSLVKTIASDFDHLAIKRNIKFTITCDPSLPKSLYIDKQVLEKVVMNLLNNAFKYTPDGGEIALETYATLSGFIPRFEHHHTIQSDTTYPGQMIIAVRDTGCGISADSIKEVFERYYLVNTTNLNQHLGTGIGLALVKSLVMLHHGSITIYSERNQGSDFVVKLPTDAEAFAEDDFFTPDSTTSIISVPGVKLQEVTSDNVSEESGIRVSSESDDDAPNQRKRIMLVEDNDDLRTLIAGFLKLHFDIVEAPDGVEALKLLDNSHVDLIISDIMMPKMDGITLCRKLKGNVDTSHIPVMLLTARTGVENQMEGADAGADLYFSKPIDFNLLLQSIRNIFRHHQNLRDHYSRNYYADQAELTSNRQDSEFLEKITGIIDSHIVGDNIDVNFLANEMGMSRSKLYSKLKALTGKSIVEFIMNHRMRKAARIIVEQDLPLYMVMEMVGIRSQSHFVNSFKKEFGETPSSFVARHRSKA